MLTSLTPVGEAARQQRWSVTAAAYVLAALAGGALAGAVMGGVGQALTAAGLALGSSPGALLALAAAAAAAVAVDLTGRRVPAPRRQVNERWLDTYRGWVYGAGFGLQLGLGFATIVTSAAVPLALLAATLTGSWARGMVVGAVFGATRGLPLLLTRRVRTVGGLRAFARAVADRTRLARRATLAAQGGVAVAAVVATAAGLLS